MVSIMLCRGAISGAPGCLSGVPVAISCTQIVPDYLFNACSSPRGLLDISQEYRWNSHSTLASTH